MLKFAITGNIASGKSLVEDIISEYYPVYDTDKIAHDILNNITEFYGENVFTDGKIDRKKLGDLIFSNPKMKKNLENIVHPQIKDRLEEIFIQNKNEKFVFVSVPLLYETDFYKIFDKVIFVSADEDIRLKRLMKRNNFTKDEAKIRIKAQMPETEKIKKADYIIKNNSTISELEQQVNIFLSNLKHL